MIPGGSDICVIENDDPDVIPRLCLTDGDLAVADMRTLRHTVSEKLSSGEAPTVFSQTLLVFKPGKAAHYLGRLRTTLSSCPSSTRAGMKITYSRADGPSAGDEVVSMKVEYRYLKPVEGMPQVRTFRVIVVRLGDQVSVVCDHGWEGAPSQDQTIFNASAEGARLLAVA
ncbi:hypothetical protein Rhe02_28940 [Rhizocola hellebori]|uniref:Uncharacterized protein n=2 Tax=Rhizocola hellebori TaxID=1392758 RepID=A0A8J3VG72_9ACTN|nr:hypothetical protein Rhe02_28940 [Rhizocola hellebori]